MASRNGSQARKREDHDTASDLEQLFGYNLKRAYIIFQTDFRKALGPDGLGQILCIAGACCALSEHHPTRAGPRTWHRPIRSGCHGG